MGYYIYKYVNNGEVEYIGKTTNLERRIQQHTKDKLKDFVGQIYYFECPHQTAMNSWEYFLINKYHPKYNESLNNNNFTAIIGEPEWMKYMGNSINVINFSNYYKAKKQPKSTSIPKPDTSFTKIISPALAVRFTCRHCKTVFETTNWYRTKGNNYAASCPACPYTAHAYK